MAQIFHQFTVKAPRERVFEAVSTPQGLDCWWTKTSAGEPRTGAVFALFFGPGYDWRARMTRCVPASEFELEMTEAHPDWKGTRIGCKLESEGEAGTSVLFYHTGWPEENDHWRISSYCWAMYLRIMRRYVEYGETVPYDKRLEV